MKILLKSRQRVFWLIGLFSASCLTTSFLAILYLYDLGVKDTKARLTEIVESHASLMEVIAKHNFQVGASLGQSRSSAEEHTLEQFREAHRNFSGMGQTGEFTLGKRQGDQIVFLLSHRLHDLNNLQPIAWNVAWAGPMRNALKGLSGSFISLDYRGEEVLAAYRPVESMKLGIVAKIDLAEVRQSYLRAGLIVMGITLVVVSIGAFLFLRITEPILAQLVARTAELEEADQTKNRFFSIIAHDLRGPMGANSGLLSWMLRNAEQVPKERLIDALKIVQRSTENTYNMLEQLLAWAHCQSNHIAAKPRWLNLAALISQVLEFEQEVAAQKEVELPPVPQGEIPVFADREMLGTVLRNLISNAIKYSYFGGKIELVYDAADKTLRSLEVHDHGTGIDQAGQEGLFRTDLATSKPGTQGEPGTGLGLILCRELMHKMGGALCFKEPAHPGSCFIVQFPQAPVPKPERLDEDQVLFY
ncbi:MAG: HAMP domain-containing sensor histidine kinase [bacterium]|nr:HAMP domain-containing sensor histidine kinase [bacterium]